MQGRETGKWGERRKEMKERERMKGENSTRTKESSDEVVAGVVSVDTNLPRSGKGILNSDREGIIKTDIAVVVVESIGVLIGTNEDITVSTNIPVLINRNHQVGCRVGSVGVIIPHITGCIALYGSTFNKICVHCSIRAWFRRGGAEKGKKNKLYSQRSPEN